MSNNQNQEPKSVDKAEQEKLLAIRDIIFGKEIQEYNQEFVELKTLIEKNKEETDQADKDLMTKMEALGSELKNAIASLDKKLSTDIQNQSIRDLQEEMEESLNNRKIPDTEIQQIIGHIVKVMPDKLGPAITRTLKVQIKESRAEVVQVLYPIMGQMIKSYIQKEMQMLTEKIDSQFERAFSSEHLIMRIKSFFGGVKYSEMIMKNTLGPQIKEVFVIEEGSGLILGSYSNDKSLDEDMVAGMLTAIKSFVKDAFQKEEQNLEMIEYELYKIYIQHFNNFYISVVFAGSSSARFKSAMNDAMLKMVKENTGFIENHEDLPAQRIQQYFNKINEIT